MRWRILSFSSIPGSTTEGFCSPSRSVSSKNDAFLGKIRPFRFTSFQSKTRLEARSPSVANFDMNRVCHDLGHGAERTDRDQPQNGHARDIRSEARGDRAGTGVWNGERENGRGESTMEQAGLDAARLSVV